MNMRSLWKNGWLLAAVLILPIILYAAYQLSTLSEDEANLEMIYQNQLDAVLFSVNQYSDDLVSGWVNEIEHSLEDPAQTDSLITNKLFQFHPSIFQVMVFEEGNFHLYENWDADTVLSGSFYKNEILEGRSDQLDKLQEYAKNNFQKIESVPVYRNDHLYLALYFVLLTTDNEPTDDVGAIFMDPQLFVSETLSSKFQTVAQEKFIISAFQRGNETPVYTTADSIGILSGNAAAVTNDFWLVPDYYLAIGTAGTPVNEIIKQRTVTNLTLLLLLMGFLIIAGLLIFRNVKRELGLAQKKADFVSNVSHELRTPLALISMFAETLEMGRVKSDEKRQEYYQIMQKETSRLTGIVNKVLTFSQIESGKKQFRHDALEMNDIVSEVLSNYEFHLHSKGFSHEVMLSDTKLPLEGDKEALAEVIINLLDNAIKYTRDEKFIRVSTRRLNGSAQLVVEDHGIGIPKKDQQQIFEKFFRVSVGDLAQSKGTGLGLSLVKQIISEHKGAIEVDSEVGKGSTFTVTIPLTQ